MLIRALPVSGTLYLLWQYRLAWENSDCQMLICSLFNHRLCDTRVGLDSTSTDFTLCALPLGLFRTYGYTGLGSGRIVGVQPTVTSCPSWNSTVSATLLLYSQRQIVIWTEIDAHEELSAAQTGDVSTSASSSGRPLLSRSRTWPGFRSFHRRDGMASSTLTTFHGIGDQQMVALPQFLASGLSTGPAFWH